MQSSMASGGTAFSKILGHLPIFEWELSHISAVLNFSVFDKYILFYELWSEALASNYTCSEEKGNLKGPKIIDTIWLNQ